MAARLSPSLAAALAITVAFATAAGAQPSPSATAAPADDATTAMAHEHAHDSPTPSPAVGRGGGLQTIVARNVEYATVAGKPVQGYLAQDKGTAKGAPAIILIHEWWGLNENLRDLARQLAGFGYTTLAVDLYGGKTAKTPDAAQALMKEAMAHPDRAEDNLRQAYAFLHDKEGARKVGVVGWCFGGGWSLQTGLLLPGKIDAVVMYYGFPETDKAKLATLEAPLLGLFGAEDQAIKVEAVRQFESTLKELKKDASIHVFPGAGHAFANPSGGSFVREAAGQSWKLTLDFFAKHLKG